MDSPSSALIGVVGIGLGSLIAYGAYKNVSIFGPNGLLGETIATGKIPDVNSLSKLFAPQGIGVEGETTLGAAESAIATIAKKNPTLGSQLQAELASWSAVGVPPDGTTRLKALVAEARAQGFSAQADAIQSYIMDVARNPVGNATPEVQQT